MRIEDRRRDAAQDRVLLRVAAAGALFAATGAAALTLAPGEPGLRGLQHLALFAQPARGLASKPPPVRPNADATPEAERVAVAESRRAPAAAAPADRFAAPATPSPRLVAAPALSDPATVGALADKPSARLSARAAATPLTAWRIYDVVGERALLAGPAGIAWVWAGVDLGEAGVVARIEMERDGVAVITSRGEIRRR